MAKTETRTEVPAEKGGGRIDSVKPPANLPATSPFDRMTELARRILGVPRTEAIPPKRGRKKGKSHE